MMGRSVAVMLAVVGLTGSAQSQDLQPPFTGSVQQVGGNGAMTWTCSAPSSADGSISCNFIQVTISKATLPDRETEAAKLLGVGAEKECEGMEKTFADLARNASGPGVESWARTVLDETVAAYRRLCEERDIRAALNVIDLQQSIEAKTCRISTWPFALTFRRSTSADRWEALDGPAGACGVLKVITLEPDYALGPNLPLWNYEQRSIVTAPAGTSITGQSCAEWPEEKMSYTWRSRAVRPMCEMVKHGLF